MEMVSCMLCIFRHNKKEEETHNFLQDEFKNSKNIDQISGRSKHRDNDGLYQKIECVQIRDRFWKSKGQDLVIE